MGKQLIGGLLMLVIVLVVIYILLKQLGLVKSAAIRKIDEQVKKDANELARSDYFDVNFANSVGAPQSSLISAKKVEEIGTKINKALPYYHIVFGFLSFYTDEEAIFAAFRELPYKVNISQISRWFSDEKGKDLLSELQSNLNEKELSQLWVIINQKPLK